jgi:hypothetical protein
MLGIDPGRGCALARSKSLLHVCEDRRTDDPREVIANGIHRIERDVRISERRQLMGKRAKAAILPGIILSKVVLKHAKDSANLLDVLARFEYDLSLARCGVPISFNALSNSSATTREMSLDGDFFFVNR